MIFVVAEVEFGRLAGVVSFRADEVGSVTEGLRGGLTEPRAWTSLLHFSAFLRPEFRHICRTDSQ